MDGLKVREYLIRLKCADKSISQRWLVRQLRKNGFSTLWEPQFTNILDGLKTANSDMVLETAINLLKKEADRLNINLN